MGDVVNGLSDGFDFISLAVWDENGELVLDFHEDFHGVEGVESEVLVEGGSGGYGSSLRCSGV